MIMKTRIRLGCHTIFLTRELQAWNKQFPDMAWRVEFDNFIWGYVAEYKNTFYKNQIGHRIFQQKFWLAFKKPNIVIPASTRFEAVKQLLIGRL